MEKIANKRPPGFMLYEESIKLLSSMPENKAGEIIQAVCRLYETGETVEMEDPLYNAILTGIIEKMARDAADYAKTCEENARKANKRWHPEKYE